MKCFLILLTWSFLFVFPQNEIFISEPIDLTKHVKSLHNGNESTSLSIYDTNPESPDGKHICYIHYSGIVQGGHNSGVIKSDVMIKNRLTGDTKKISEIRTDNHNGANTFWIDNTKIAYMGHYLHYFEVYDIKKNKLLYGPVKGELGHKSFQGKIFFSACNLRLLTPNKFREKFNVNAEGIYCLNVKSGDIKLVVSKKDIHIAFLKQNSHVTDKAIEILHVEPSPDNKSIFFDFRQQGVGSLHGYVKADGTGVRWVQVRPMHVVWYDNTTMLGVKTDNPEKKIFRFDTKGNPLEMLGGTSTHVGASPDRNWYVGESAYYGPEEDGYTRVYLYQKGVREPVAILAEWKNSKITWKWVAHVNPSFSFDGKRIYFIRASDIEDKFEAVYLEISEYLNSIN